MQASRGEKTSKIFPSHGLSMLQSSVPTGVVVKQLLWGQTKLSDWICFHRRGYMPCSVNLLMIYGMVCVS